MTAIAYRDGVMAADSYEGFDFVKTQNFEKVVKERGYLFGITGEECPSNEDFIKWFFKKGRKKSEWKELNFSCLVVDPKGRMTLVSHKGYSVPLKQPFFAVGIGAECCLGAMEVGATAAQAVEAACKWVDGVILPVLTVEL